MRMAKSARIMQRWELKVAFNYGVLSLVRVTGMAQRLTQCPIAHHVGHRKGTGSGPTAQTKRPKPFNR